MAQRSAVDRALRVGLAARGVAYLVLGYLVARVAFGALGGPGTSQPASGTGVAQTIVQQTGGRAALVVLAVGLALYAGFSALDAATHHDTESPAAKRWGDRALSAWGVVVYGAFSVYCLVTAAAPEPARHDSAHSRWQDTQWSARVLRWPAGQVWLGLLGAVLLVIAAFLVLRTVRRSFRPRLERDRMSRANWRGAVALGTIGYFGRALLFGIVGWFVMGAAIEDDPEHGQGVDGSIRLLAHARGGAAVLWLLASCLVGYATYLFVEARFRRV